MKITGLGIICMLCVFKIYGQDVDLESTFNLSLTDEQRKEIKANIKASDELISKDSTDAFLYLNRGVEYSKLGLYPQAISDYNKCIRIDSLIPEAYFNRGIAKARFRYTKDACLDVKKAYHLGLETAKDTYNENCGLYMHDIGKIDE